MEHCCLRLRELVQENALQYARQYAIYKCLVYEMLKQFKVTDSSVQSGTLFSPLL